MPDPIPPQPIHADVPRRLSARELILALTDSSNAATLSASYYIAAGSLFDMDSGSIRVALARLVKDSALSTAGRGLYQRDNRDGELHSMVRHWANVEENLISWSGTWLGASVGHLNRGNRTRVRSWERALRLLGFAAYEPDLWLRPANLRASVAELRERMLELGFPNDGLLMEISSLAPAEQWQPEALWPISDLELGYQNNLDQLRDSTTQLKTMDSENSARETLLVGRAVTRAILLDPLLPEQLINIKLRRQMIVSMQHYDHLGKAIWRNFYQRHEGIA
jgi:phenylacetic acid degradation operon negative regulatory protein